MSTTSHTPTLPAARRAKRGSDPGMWAVVSLLLGLLVGVLGFVAVAMWSDARDARHSANASQAATANDSASMPGMDMSAQSAAAPSELQSYAGAAPTNAAAIAAAHKPYPAALPAIPAGPVANVNLALTDRVVQIAPGVKYSAWAWAGGAPGPVIHVRQGQLVKITLTNNGAIPHSVDFHAARVAPDKAFRDVNPASRSATPSGPTTPACSCTTAAPSRS